MALELLIPAETESWIESITEWKCRRTGINSIVESQSNNNCPNSQQITKNYIIIDKTKGKLITLTCSVSCFTEKILKEDCQRCLTQTPPKKSD